MELFNEYSFATHPWEYIQHYIAPLLLGATWAIFVLMNPIFDGSILHELSWFQTFLPYASVFVTWIWIIFSAVYTIRMLIQYGILAWCWDTIKTFARTIWNQIVLLKSIYIVKAISTTFGILLVALCVQWIYRYFSIWRFIKTVADFLWEMILTLRDVDKLIRTINMFINENFIGWTVVPIRYLYNWASVELYESPVRGMGWICLFAVIFIIIIIGGYHLSQWYYQIKAEVTGNVDQRQNNEDNGERRYARRSANQVRVNP